jgi:hypothetical protein
MATSSRLKKHRGHNMTTEEKIKAYLDEKKLQGGRK